ncbi:MAG: YigZ family protein [Desulfovibrionaceae bacterium]|nr:YigZ family protein [Desulfovibrionaceae bacterium]
MEIPLATRAQPHTCELVIKRSRFLAQASYVADLADGRAFVEEVRSLHPDATHNCWACVGGASGDTGHAASSDDGEPRGTAGRPMLTILLHSGIGHVCLVVTRWFGGIKLGTGGLVRAYQDAVRENLAGLATREYCPMQTLRVTISYAAHPLCTRLFAAHSVTVLSEEFGESITLHLRLPIVCAEPFVAAVTAATKGSCVIVRESCTEI